MDDRPIEMPVAAATLLAAAERLEHAAADRRNATVLAPSLEPVTDAMHAVARALDAAARSIVPVGGPHESICDRYSRAAAEWPGMPRDAAPSHEQQARLLMTLNDASAALRSAARRTERARDVVASSVGVGGAIGTRSGSACMPPPSRSERPDPMR